jgi:hypothetical protein
MKEYDENPEDWDDILREMFLKLFGKMPEELENMEPGEELDEIKEKFKNFLDNYDDFLNKKMDIELPNFDFDDYDNKSLFIQDLDDEEASERFKDFTEDYDMDLYIEFYKEGGMDMVKEEWTNFDGTINITKVYEYNLETIEKLDSYTQLKIYELKLEESVEKEEYENAALLRDKIEDLNSDE